MSFAPRNRTRSSRGGFTAKAPESAPGIWWRAGVIVIAGALAYSNSLSGPFIFDDQLSIVENSQIRDLGNLSSVLAPESELPTAGRPLVNLSFAINYALGGLDVRGYHLVNIAIHLLCALLVFGIIRRTLELPSLHERWAGASTNVGFAVAILWTLHPLNTEAVNYLTQRTELMMALCYLLTLYASILARRPNATDDHLWRALAVVSCAAGMVSKESMVTAPVMVVLYDAIFVFASIKEALRKRWRFYATLAMSWIALAVVIWSGPRAHSAGFSSGVSPWQYLLNQTVMITHYLGFAVWPRGLVVNYGFPFQATLGGVLPYALVIVGVIALTVAALIRSPKWGFLGVWFLVTLAPTSSFVPIATEVGAERRMYLPLVALVVLAVVGASCIKRIGASGAAGAVITLVFVATALTVGTFTRNREYTSPLLLARTVVERHPTSVAHHVLGTELIIAGERDEAMVHLRRALPGAPRAHYTLGAWLIRDGKLDEGIEELQAFVREQPMLLEAVSARQLLGQAFAKQQRWLEGIEQYRIALTMNPSYEQRAQIQAALAQSLFKMQSFDEAIVYTEYLKTHPNDVAALNQLAIRFLATDRPTEAIGALRRAVALDPNNAAGQRNLANALFDHGDVDAAAVHAERLVRLQPDSPAAHAFFGRVLAMQGKLAEAQSQFEQALQLDRDYAEARQDLVKPRRRLTPSNPPISSSR